MFLVLFSFCSQKVNDHVPLFPETPRWSSWRFSRGDLVVLLISVWIRVAFDFLSDWRPFRVHSVLLPKTELWSHDVDYHKVKLKTISWVSRAIIAQFNRLYRNRFDTVFLVIGSWCDGVKNTVKSGGNLELQNKAIRITQDEKANTCSHFQVRKPQYIVTAHLNSLDKTRSQTAIYCVHRSIRQNHCQRTTITYVLASIIGQLK